jgi:hypothetical protein
MRPIARQVAEDLAVSPNWAVMPECPKTLDYILSIFTDEERLHP